MKTILTLAATLLLAYGSTAAPNAVPACDDTGTVVHTAKPRRVKGSERLVTRDLGRIGAYEVLYVSDGIEAVVSAAVSTLVITADDNVIDRIVTRSDGKRLTMRIDARSITDCTVRAVIPASAALRTLEAESMGTIRCEVPLGNGPGPVTVRSSEGSRIAADIRTGDDIRVHVSGCSRFEGALKGNNCKISVTEGSRADTRIEASGICRVDVSASSRASGSLKAHHCALSLTEGSVADMPVTSTGESTLVISSSSRFNGALKGNNCKISVTEGSVFDAPLTCEVHGEIILDASSRFAGDASAGNSLHIKAANGSVMQGNADADVEPLQRQHLGRGTGRAEKHRRQRHSGCFRGRPHLCRIHRFIPHRPDRQHPRPLGRHRSRLRQSVQRSRPAVTELFRNGNVVGTRRSPLHRRTAGNHLVGRYSLLQ